MVNTKMINKAFKRSNDNRWLNINLVPAFKHTDAEHRTMFYWRQPCKLITSKRFEHNERELQLATMNEF